MKTILCYGDSNTYGYNPHTGGRFSNDERWTGVLSKLLGEDYHLVEEGLNGRTVNYTDEEEPYKNGSESLKLILGSHRPLDIVVMMLGTNDLKFFYHRSIEDISEGMTEMVKETKEFLKLKQGYEPKIILCSPIPIGEQVLTSVFSCEMDKDSIEKSKSFSKYYGQIAKNENCIFFDANTMFEPSCEDCMHMSKETHKEFAEKLCQLIKNL